MTPAELLHFDTAEVLERGLISRPVYLLENSFFFKVNSRKVNYFSMFGSVMKNKLANTFQCLVMS